MAIIDDRTGTRNYPKPNVANNADDDAGRLAQALDLVDADVAAILLALMDKASQSHSHPMSEIVGLVQALAEKAALNHQHALAGLTDVDVSSATNGQWLRRVGSKWVPATPTIAAVDGLQQVLDQKAATDGQSLVMPGGPVGGRPTSPTGFRLRYNSSSDTLEFFNGTTWRVFDVAEALLKARNLSDLPDKASARTALGVPSAQDMSDALSVKANLTSPTFLGAVRLAGATLEIESGSPLFWMTRPGVKRGAWFVDASGNINWQDQNGQVHIRISSAGEVWTQQLGDLNSRIEARASAYSASALAQANANMQVNDNAVLSSANGTALAYANQRVSAVAIGSSWTGFRPPGGVLTNAFNDAGSWSFSGGRIYYYIPNSGWVAGGDI